MNPLSDLKATLLSIFYTFQIDLDQTVESIIDAVSVLLPQFEHLVKFQPTSIEKINYW